MIANPLDVVDINRARPMTREEKKVIFASSVGTIFEWYDFYLYGSLAAIIGAQFFTAFPEATRGVFALLAFAAGFIVRPFGALVFGSLGDLIGRKYTFLTTILIMGLATFLVGLLPGYQSWGIAAPIILVALRMLQGLALGGEYGGAATYVAEHAPINRRGYYTSFIQTTATLGLFLSLLVIMAVTAYVNGNFDTVAQFNLDGTPLLDPTGAQVMLEPFKAWGWRIPFLGSIFLLMVSLYIRLQMNESPAFTKMKEEGAASKAPLREAFGQWKNAKFAVIALFGLTAGQAVVWYSGQFYVLYFLQNISKVDSFTANTLVAWSLALGTIGFVIFGALSDRIGRKPIILAGCLIAAITYFPVFKMINETANPALAAAQENTVVSVQVDPAECHFQFNPVGTAKFTSSCDIATAILAKNSVNYSKEPLGAGSPSQIQIGETVVPSFDGAANAAAIKLATTTLETAKAGTDQAAIDSAQAALDAEKGVKAGFEKAVNDALIASGFPLIAKDNATVVKSAGVLDIFSGQHMKLLVLMTFLIILVTMVYGPIAAMLVELFPTRIRYSGMSLPYHIGNGWFGGMLPFLAAAIAVQAGDIFAGLWYAIIVALATVVVGTIFVPSGTHKKSIFTDDPQHRVHH